MDSPTRSTQTQSVSDIESSLRAGGMPDRRASVFARHLSGFSNKAIAAELDIRPPGVTEHVTGAKDDVIEAERLYYTTLAPDYITKVGEEMVETLYENVAEHSPGFSLHNPVQSDGEYVLSGGNVIEGHYITSADKYLLIFHENTYRRDKSGFLISPEFLVEFITDWVMSNRYPPICSDDTVDEWFLTDVFNPEWLEEELEEYDISRIEATVDDRFRNPVYDTGVYCNESAVTGRYQNGYQIAYRPTDEEIAKLLSDGGIDESEAERITRKSPDVLLSIVRN